MRFFSLSRSAERQALRTALKGRVLLAAMIGLSTQVIHAQTSVAYFDSLDVRDDMAKSTIIRFQAARFHAIACMYEGRADEVRSTALLIPLHHRMEKLITSMLVSKLSTSEIRAPAGNNRVRLEAAKKTIEELEGGRGEGTGP